jgi:oligopeptide/dipeptide ABC transporter ATP-binding protein
MPEPGANGRQPAAVLEVDDLRVSIHTEEGVVEAVRGVSFDLRPGEVLGIVGESGCGKSVTAMSLIGLTGESANFELTGGIRFNGEPVLEFDEERLRRMRGAGMAMIFQDPMTSLTPVYKVGDLIAETIRAHLDCPRAEARERAVAMMREVGIPDPVRRANAYPHQLSGGLRQRVMIAMALACEPSVLIADEPTTALDVTIQAQILHLIKRLQREHGTAVVMISHDLGVIAKMADSVAVMYAGKIVEMAPVRELFAAPQHPYTWGLVGSAPRLRQDAGAKLVSIPGQPPSLIGIGEGCAFRDRCAFVHDRCARTPPLEPRSRDDHLDACWLETERRSELAESHATA